MTEPPHRRPRGTRSQAYRSRQKLTPTPPRSPRSMPRSRRRQGSRRRKNGRSRRKRAVHPSPPLRSARWPPGTDPYRTSLPTRPSVRSTRRCTPPHGPALSSSTPTVYRRSGSIPIESPGRVRHLRESPAPRSIQCPCPASTYTTTTPAARSSKKHPPTATRTCRPPTGRSRNDSPACTAASGSAVVCSCAQVRLHQRHQHPRPGPWPATSPTDTAIFPPPSSITSNKSPATNNPGLISIAYRIGPISPRGAGSMTSCAFRAA